MSKCKLLLEFGRGHRLTIARGAALKQPRVGELTNHDRIKPGITDQCRGCIQRLWIVAGDRNC